MSEVRLDKWLWAARFYKTRSLAQEQIERHRVQVCVGTQWHDVKPGRDVHPGDVLRITQEGVVREVLVKALSAQRGPAPVAQTLYEETPDSAARREAEAAAKRLAPMPGQDAGWHDGKGRPTKRDRRALQRIAVRGDGKPYDW